MLDKCLLLQMTIFCHNHNKIHNKMCYQIDCKFFIQELVLAKKVVEHGKAVSSVRICEATTFLICKFALHFNHI